MFTISSLGFVPSHLAMDMETGDVDRDTKLALCDGMLDLLDRYSTVKPHVEISLQDDARQFTQGYIEAMLLADSPEDDQFERSDFSDQAKSRVFFDCVKFWRENREMIKDNPGQAGHDFWLTRQGHGAGYWDGDWPEFGDALTASSERFGEVNIYRGDDGLIYID